MKNIFNKKEDLKLYNKNGTLRYKFYTYLNGDSGESTYDSNGNKLTYKDSNGDSYECTYDSNGNVLTHKDSRGFSYEYTRDSNGNELTFKNSNGVRRGFDTPETLKEFREKHDLKKEELVEWLNQNYK